MTTGEIIAMVLIWIFTMSPLIVSIYNKPFSARVRAIWMSVAIILPILILWIAIKLTSAS